MLTLRNFSEIHFQGCHNHFIKIREYNKHYHRTCFYNLVKRLRLKKQQFADVFKTDILKSLAILAGKHLSCSLF